MPTMGTPVLKSPGTEDVGDLEIRAPHGCSAAQSPKRLRRRSWWHLVFLAVLLTERQAIERAPDIEQCLAGDV